MKLTKTQKIVAATVLVVVIVILLASCGTALSSEVKTDSAHADTTLVDALKVDTIQSTYLLLPSYFPLQLAVAGNLPCLS